MKGVGSLSPNLLFVPISYKHNFNGYNFFSICIFFPSNLFLATPEITPLSKKLRLCMCLSHSFFHSIFIMCVTAYLIVSLYQVWGFWFRLQRVNTPGRCRGRKVWTLIGADITVTAAGNNQRQANLSSVTSFR